MYSINLLLLLFVFLSSFAIKAQCKNVSVTVNRISFEEKFVSFKGDSGRVIKRLDLFALNPYNQLAFRKYSIDEDFGMKSYLLTPSESKRYTLEVFGTLDTTLITAVNSQVDVVKEENCRVTVTYGLYRMDDAGRYISSAGRVEHYDATGKLLGVIEDKDRQIQIPVFSEYDQKLYAVYRSPVDAMRVSFSIYDLHCDQKIYEEVYQQELSSLPAMVTGTDKLFFVKNFEQSYLEGGIYFVFDPVDRIMMKFTVPKSKVRQFIRLTDKGILWRIGNNSARLEEYDEIQNIKIFQL